MKKIVAALLALLLASGAALALFDPAALIADYPDEIVIAARNAIPPDGLTDYEQEIYRLGFADGLNAATSRAYIGEEEMLYILNTANKKFHDPECRNANSMSPGKREERYCTRQSLIDEGFVPCKNCNP